MKKRVSLLLLPFLTAGALAQDTFEEEAEPEVRRYTVEMIIFAYAQNVSAGSEVFPPDMPQIIDSPLDEDLGDAITFESVPELAAEPNALEDKKYELVMLAEEDFGLVNTYEHLERLDAYEPLMHFGWTQPTYPDEEVAARPLSSFMTPPVGLEGDLTLYLSRYLHLAIKLQLDAPIPEVPQGGSSTGVYPHDDMLRDVRNEYVLPVRYRIEEDRIFKNGDLRYFDHPKFGVLARVTRVEEEEPEDDELPGNMEMLGD